ICWINGDRAIVVLDGPFVFPLLVPDESSIVEGLGVIGVEFDGPVIVMDGAVVLTFCVVGVAAVEDSLLETRIEFDRAIVVFDGAVNVALVVPGDAAIVVGCVKFFSAEFARGNQTGTGSNGNVPCLLEAGVQIAGPDGTAVMFVSQGRLLEAGLQSVG